MKLGLEGLEELAMLSASPVIAVPAPLAMTVVSSPTIAAVTSAVDSLSHLIAVLQQDVNSVSKTVTQELFSAEQRLAHLLGISPNTSSQSSATTAAPIGSGSEVAANAHENSTALSVPRIVPSVVAPPPANVYTWDPGSGNGPGDPLNNLASNPKNWLLNGNPQMGAGGTIPGNQPTDTVQFDGAYDQPIEWDFGNGKIESYNFSTMQLGVAADGKVYDQQQTIDAGITVELNGSVASTSLATNVAGSKLFLYFGNGGSVFQIDANATITNMALAGYPNGLFYLAGGTTTIAQPGGYKDTIGVDITVGASAVLNDQSFNSLQFANSNLSILVLGRMQTFYGPGAGIKLIDNNGFANDYINVDDGGDLEYYGSGNDGNGEPVIDQINVPILVQLGSTFGVQSANGQPDGAVLEVIGSNAATNNVSVYVTGQTSTVKLSEQATLEAVNDYYQAFGSLRSDNSQCTLQAGGTGQGTATIAGGGVIVDSIPNTYATLVVKAANLNFIGGQLVVSIKGYPLGNPGLVNDLLDVTGTVALNNTASSLYVYNYGTLVKGDSWEPILDNNAIQGDFAQENTTPQAALMYGPPNNPGKGIYQVNFNG